MSCRTTSRRSRSTKIVLDGPPPVEQTRKITDVFKVTRGRGKGQKKLLSSSPDGVNVKKSSIDESAVVSEQCNEQRNDVCTARKALFFNINTKLDDDDSSKLDANPQEEEMMPISTSKESSDDRVTLGNKVVSVKVKSDPLEESSSNDVETPALNPLLSKADEMLEKLKSRAVQSKARARVRNVAELQAMLAEKQSVKIIHEQSRRNKSKQVEEDANVLRNPAKFVPVGTAVAKSQKKTRTRVVEECLPKPAQLPIPDFVLPTHQTPEKQQPIDETELNEKRHVFDYGKASRLVDDVKNNSTFPLPRNYERLHVSFQSCDRVLSIFTARRRRCLVSEIQTNVEKNTKITFSRKQLAQIVHVYPTSYDIKVEKWSPFGGESKSQGKFELVIAANLTSVLLNDSELSRLRRFHPKFDLDQECEEIKEAELPHVPSDTDESYLKMKDYLATVDNSVPLPKAVDNAIEVLKSPLKKLVSSSGTPLSPRKFAEQQALKPKGAMSLVERIRAKEAAKKLAESLRDPAIEKKIEVLQRILHGLLRCITTYFAFRKVRSIDVNTLSEQIMRSQSALSRTLIMEHISTLCGTAPEYFIITEIGGKKYLQLKENNYAAVEKLLQEEVTRLRGISTSATTNVSSTSNPVSMCSTKNPAVRALF
ncbi:MFS lactose permease [Parelaphostrongylus tenuis]|uniref:MFS lactose permease n=1 Tax=Parelaphostrongylus tenuis TaxID=148309 RepID=A0AAD5WK21_PARTN|nr:MFS lactose permease [Parelaphostrongylus tenuis]